MKRKLFQFLILKPWSFSLIFRVQRIEIVAVNGLRGNDDCRAENVVRARAAGNFRNRFGQSREDLSVSGNFRDELRELGGNVSAVQIREHEHIGFASNGTFDAFDICRERVQGGVHLQFAVDDAQLRAAGADGFVIGCLTPEGDLDVAAMAPLLEAAKGAGLTLHRCIDVSRDPVLTYLDAGKLGIDTVLTSGAAGSCQKGMDIIGQLLRLRDTENSPEVLIGAGVNAATIAKFRESYPQARAFHMSGKADMESGMVFRREGVPMGLPGLDEWHIPQTSEAAIRAARMALDA